MIAEDIKNNKQIFNWKTDIMPDKYNEMYGFTNLLISLNDHPKN